MLLAPLDRAVDSGAAFVVAVCGTAGRKGSVVVLVKPDRWRGWPEILRFLFKTCQYCLSSIEKVNVPIQ